MSNQDIAFSPIELVNITAIIVTCFNGFMNDISSAIRIVAHICSFLGDSRKVIYTT